MMIPRRLSNPWSQRLFAGELALTLALPPSAWALREQQDAEAGLEDLSTALGVSAPVSTEHSVTDRSALPQAAGAEEKVVRRRFTTSVGVDQERFNAAVEDLVAGGMTLTEIAAAARISQVYLSMLRSGRRSRVSRDVAWRLKGVLGIGLAPKGSARPTRRVGPKVGRASVHREPVSPALFTVPGVLLEGRVQDFSVRMNLQEPYAVRWWRNTGASRVYEVHFSSVGGSTESADVEIRAIEAAGTVRLVGTSLSQSGQVFTFKNGDVAINVKSQQDGWFTLSFIPVAARRPAGLEEMTRRQFLKSIAQGFAAVAAQTNGLLNSVATAPSIGVAATAMPARPVALEPYQWVAVSSS